MQPLMNVIIWMVLVVWLGSMIGLGVMFAPLAFRHLATRADAGRVVGAVLTRLESLGLVSSGILLMAALVQAMDRAWVQIDLLRVLLVILMLALTLIRATMLRPRMESIRAQAGQPPEEMPEADPVRVEHRRLHRATVVLFNLNVLLGLALVVLSAIR